MLSFYVEVVEFGGSFVFPDGRRFWVHVLRLGFDVLISGSIRFPGFLISLASDVDVCSREAQHVLSRVTFLFLFSRSRFFRVCLCLDP